MNILLTGASGFLGELLSDRLDRNSRFVLTRAVRRKESLKDSRDVLIDGLHAGTDWAAALNGQDVVVHTAARAHIMKDEVPDPLAEYRKVNVEGTLNLARQAAKAGVARFIYISSILSLIHI